MSVDGGIYVIGGKKWSLNTGFLCTCEKYDPQRDSWSFIKSMKTDRVYAGVAVLDGKIFVCGGKSNDSNSTNSVEVYDPSTDEWNYAASMNERRAEFTLISFDKKLYAFGGFDWTGDKPLSSCEVYDLEKDSWSFIASLPEARYNMVGWSVNS